jgi:hypothetical protein
MNYLADNVYGRIKKSIRRQGLKGIRKQGSLSKVRYADFASTQPTV